MEFINFNEKIQKQFTEMCNTGKLFRADVSTSKIWETYLNSFKPENNKVFRDPESSEHNCNCCHNFIRRYGNIVSINSDGNLESLFSNISDVGEYQDSVDVCRDLIVNSNIKDVFFETFNELDKNLNYESCKKSQDVFQLGVKSNLKKYTKEEADKFGVVSTDKVYEFEHFNIQLPKQFVDMSGKSIEQIMAFYRDKYQVFKRAMEEIPLDTLNLVKDLINQGSLLDGTSHLHAVEEYISMWSKLADTAPDKDSWYWNTSYELEERTAKFKNTLIGVLCTELAEGMDLNKACENWNKRVDPINYHKVTAPITQRQIKEAQMFVEENGYIESFDRRLATIDDIKVDEILHSNVGDSKVKSASIFDNMKATSTQHKRAEFDKLEEVSIEKFMKDIISTCTSMEVYLENRMQGNLCTLTKAVNNDSKPIFKWSNNYSWTFNGNLAGKSQIKSAVKDRGGNIDADVRISIHFPDTTDDYDLHCYEPNGNHIYYSNRRVKHASSGMLDLDAQGVDGNFPPEKRVENLVYYSKSQMYNGIYNIKVNNYNGKGIHTKFYIEVEIDGDITTMVYNKNKANTVDIGILEVKNSNVVFKQADGCEIIESKSVSKEMWNLETNKFHKVNLVCLSPNHWGDNNSGNLHYMFMLEGCKAEGSIRTFHNENLIPELLKFKKVMETLGATNMIEPTENHLAGIGFNSTIHDELIVKLQGTHKRMIKIKL